MNNSGNKGFNIPIPKNNVTRNSSFELLRIIAMFMIVFHHSNVHGLKFDVVFSDCNNIDNILSYIFFKCIIVLGPIGNYIFMLISGYFLSEKEENIPYLKKTWSVMFFYSFFITVFIFLKNPVYRDLIHIFPFFNEVNWYSNAYIVFLLFLPFFNILVKSLNIKTHFYLVILLFTLFAVSNIWLYSGFVASKVYPFILCFFISTYIKFYSPKFSTQKLRCLILSIILISLIFIWYYFIFISFKQIGWKEDRTLHVCTLINTLTLPISVFIFCFFLNVRHFYSNIINVISSTTFGIYLIHDNKYFRNILWSDIFCLNKYPSFKIIPKMLVITLIIFITCCIIDIFRSIIFKVIITNRITHRISNQY